VADRAALEAVLALFELLLRLRRALSGLNALGFAGLDAIGLTRSHRLAAFLSTLFFLFFFFFFFLFFFFLYA
jgi:hypothetical protein